MGAHGLETSEWFSEAFGDVGMEVGPAIYRAAVAAHERSRDAKLGSGLKSNEAYGATSWVALPQEVAEALHALPGTEVVRPARARYDLAVVGDVLVLVLKLPTDCAGPDELVITSDFRRNVLALSGIDDEELDFGDYELTDADGQPVVPGRYGSAERAVLVVVAATAQGGVQRIYIGDVRVGEEGHVRWLHREELPLGAFREASAGLVGLRLEPSESFAAAPIPDPELTLVDRSAGASENGADEVIEPGTEEVERHGS